MTTPVKLGKVTSLNATLVFVVGDSPVIAAWDATPAPVHAKRVASIDVASGKLAVLGVVQEPDERVEIDVAARVALELEDPVEAPFAGRRLHIVPA